jgi:hypothetical protein
MANDINAADSSRNSHVEILARGRLSDAKKWFDHRGWKALPQNDRGRSIMRWGADQAWLAERSSERLSWGSGECSERSASHGRLARATPAT